MLGKQLVASKDMETRIRAAAENRLNPETFIVAPTDAREVYGLDEALRRGERYARVGADGIFIEARLSVGELERVGTELRGIPLVVNMFEGGRTPMLRPSELENLGFRIVIYGVSLLMHITRLMQVALEDIRTGELKMAGAGAGFDEYREIVGFPRWAELESR